MSNVSRSRHGCETPQKEKKEGGRVDGGNPLTPTDKMMVQLAGLLQRFSAQTHSAQRIDVTSIGIESCTRSLYAFAPSLILLVAPCGVGRVLFQRLQPGRPYIMSPVGSQQTKKLHRLAPHIHGKTRRRVGFSPNPCEYCCIVKRRTS